MKKYYIIYAGFLFSLIYEFFPNYGEIGFPFTDTKVRPNYYFYYIGEHLHVLALYYVIFLQAKRKDLAYMLFMLQIFAFSEFLLNYNEAWFEVMQLKFDMNYLILIIMTLCIWGSYRRSF